MTPDEIDAKVDEYVRTLPIDEWPVWREGEAPTEMHWRELLARRSLYAEMTKRDVREDLASDRADGYHDGNLLREALQITTGPRANAYGHASVNLGRTARLMDAYLDGLDRPLTAGDVAALMICVKLARLHQSPDHYDTLLDVAGYASAAWDAVTGPDDAL